MAAGAAAFGVLVRGCGVAAPGRRWGGVGREVEDWRNGRLREQRYCVVVKEEMDLYVWECLGEQHWLSRPEVHSAAGGAGLSVSGRQRREPVALAVGAGGAW